MNELLFSDDSRLQDIRLKKASLKQSVSTFLILGALVAAYLIAIMTGNDITDNLKAHVYIQLGISAILATLFIIVLIISYRGAVLQMIQAAETDVTNDYKSIWAHFDKDDFLDGIKGYDKANAANMFKIVLKNTYHKGQLQTRYYEDGELYIHCDNNRYKIDLVNNIRQTSVETLDSEFQLLDIYEITHSSPELGYIFKRVALTR